MPNLIEERVELARKGENPFVICRMKSGWLAMGDVQPLPGYCLLLADPVAESLNALEREARVQYALDMIAAGDALLAATKAVRINYEILGNSEPALHTHIIPRYADEEAKARTRPAFMAYDWRDARPFDPGIDGPLMAKLRALLSARANP
jgi:diadenosine tetraphosphate (Ap4A) HIT family hydrolase